MLVELRFAMRFFAINVEVQLGCAAEEIFVMRLVLGVFCFAILVAGCGNTKENSSNPGASSAKPTEEKPSAVATSINAVAPSPSSGAVGSIGGANAASAESFFAGDVPAGVKMKAIKTFAIEPGILFLQGVEGWSGGQLPGYDYMGMSKDQSAVVRIVTSTAVVTELTCNSLSSAAAMAPLKAKNVKESAPTVMRQVGKNKFVAREGTCTADGQKGPVEIHFIDILRKNREEFWHYAAMAAFPADASPELKNEAMAWARSLDYQGGNGYKMP